ncbi:MAG: hypothetical protein IT393_07440 [Nitrospirae bacterium]|nr:hypothetical protein [Nitrospirota bacterium]
MSDDTTTLGSMIRVWCNLWGWPYSERSSLVTWGTGYLSPSPDGPKVIIDKQQWGWDKARDYYELALNSPTVEERESYFTKTFQSLGQVLHLIEDGAQPAHVRNDFTSHLTYTGVELSPPWRWFGSQFEHYVKNHPGLVASAEPIKPIFVNARLTDFWDTNQYVETNPPQFNDLTVGITEFTNVNYFSDSTIPGNSPTPEHTFPYPQVNSTNARICLDYAPGSTDVRKYISRNSKGDCPPPSAARLADHFATPSFLNEEYLITEGNIPTLKLWLDENVHSTYATELLPRAVGYSAALIDYFFRGKLDFVIDEGDRGDGTKGIRIYNLSDEEMEGTFYLYYDATDGNRYLLGSSSLLLSPQGLSAVLSFSVPNNNIEEDRYVIVFRGRIGMEQEAVAGYIHGAGWREEWDAGLYENHNWVYSETDLAGQNPNNGMTINNMLSGKLVKENIRYAGEEWGRANETYIGVADEVSNGTYYHGGYAIPYDFTDRFPMQVNSDTWLSLKIDDMTINEPIPAQSCGMTEWPTGDYQGLSFEFRLGDGGTRKLVFTVSGHESYMWPTILVPVAQDYSINVYDLLVAWGGITEPVYLDGINIIQQMLNLCAPSSIEHRQHMEVDYIRLEKR